ncbi:hypothetical protein OGATHE_003897 [Ogataea polymorpha]|uniref:Uncharacterized protein n=1 Tax=Ogataea polymorpha TaxID=460523 RepID=A0A9P8P517_9ASCO|nr:hypothetical protein OGATHE_003897 [Ogataea polymorpha]
MVRLEKSLSKSCDEDGLYTVERSSKCWIRLTEPRLLYFIFILKMFSKLIKNLTMIIKMSRSSCESMDNFIKKLRSTIPSSSS